MEDNEKFEKFAKALIEYVHKANERLSAEGNRKRISSDDVETLIDKLKYYLEHQEKIKKELQEPLDKYRKLYEAKSDDDVEWTDKVQVGLELIDYIYTTIYLRSIPSYGNDEILKYASGLAWNWISRKFQVALCYTYDGSTLTFGMWDVMDERNPIELVELARIAVNTRLQFKDEEELKDLVEKIASKLVTW